MSVRTRVVWPILASLVAAAQVADHVHLALVRHELCLEHGELVEAGAAPASRLQRDPLDGVQTHFDRGEPRVQSGDHQHCLATVAARQQATPRPRIAVAAPARAPLLVSLQPSIDPVPTLAAIRLAPKQSPPTP
jgi:hypothetical protein